jgi:hypothetical protein
MVLGIKFKNGTVEADKCDHSSCYQLLIVLRFGRSYLSIQQPPLGPKKLGCYAEGCLKKISRHYGFRLVIMASDWPLLTGGRYSEGVFRTGLTALLYKSG